MVVFPRIDNRPEEEEEEEEDNDDDGDGVDIRAEAAVGPPKEDWRVLALSWRILCLTRAWKRENPSHESTTDSAKSGSFVPLTISVCPAIK